MRASPRGAHRVTYADSINKTSIGSYIYKHCDARTSTCPNEAVVEF